jgi:phosphatidylglycerol---prolipoprotein diacylglyceryl transferase
MQFPYYLHLGSFRLHPHVLFEALAYAVGFRIYVALRRTQGDIISPSQRWSIIVASALGAAVGSRMLFWCENPGLTAAHWHEITYLLSGKTIVGGLLGGLIAVEITKRLAGTRTATGDVFAVPLCIAIAIGRIGCFLTGLSDNTYGTSTRPRWGVDFGDGIRRHPVQIYEIILLIVLAFSLWRFSKSPHRIGDVFKLFMLGYLAIRLALDFLKPDVRVALGLSSIQIACIAGLIYYAIHLRKIFVKPSPNVARAGA